MGAKEGFIMSNELIIANKTELDIWECPLQLKEIKEVFCKDLTTIEFNAYVGMGKATGLNPFLRELWAVKYDKNKPASIFIGRDGYRLAAQRHPAYEHHQCDAIYENDDFSVEDCIPKHHYNLKNRGKLLGAYATLRLKTSPKVFYVFVNLKEYDKGQSNWNSMKETMIKKVAESQVFRMGLQGMFAGSYHEAEQYHVEGKIVHTSPETDELNSSLGLIENTSELLNYDISSLTRDINDSLTLDVLAGYFKIHSKTVRANESHLNLLIELKDKRKAELEAIKKPPEDNKEWLDAFNNDTGEVK
jgi:phage recombination protein Bet